MPAGIIVGGPQSRTCAPSFVSAWRSERATREWLMSPTMATVFPSSVPELLAEREAVEEPLARVLVRAVAGGDDRAADAARRRAAARRRRSGG